MANNESLNLLPVSVLTGYLGAGKTTLLNHLLTSPTLTDTVVVVNEYGEVGIDHLIVATPTENTVLLKNGCLCCMVRGELTETLVDLARRRSQSLIQNFARVIVETSGIADPFPILQSLLGDDEIAEAYRLATVITVVDAVNGLNQINEGAESAKQIAVADRLVISKADLASAEAISALESRLSAMNPSANIVHAVRGEGLAYLWSADGALSIDVRPNGAHAPRLETAGQSAEAYRHENIRTFAVTWNVPATMAGLHTWLHLLASFNGPRLLRLKGIVNVQGAPILIDGVQRLIHEPRELPAWPSSDRDSVLVFITRGLEQQHIEATLDVMGYGAEGGGAGLDPTRYARFVSMASRFQTPSRQEAETQGDR